MNRLKMLPVKEKIITGVKINPESKEPIIAFASVTTKAERKSSCQRINNTNTFARPILKKGSGLGRKFSRVKITTAKIEKAAKIKILLFDNFI